MGMTLTITKRDYPTTARPIDTAGLGTHYAQGYAFVATVEDTENPVLCFETEDLVYENIVVWAGYWCAAYPACVVVDTVKPAAPVAPTGQPTGQPTA